MAERIPIQVDPYEFDVPALNYHEDSQEFDHWFDVAHPHLAAPLRASTASTAAKDRRPRSKKSSYAPKISASDFAGSDIQDIFAKHNAKFKRAAAYEPPKHAMRDVRAVSPLLLLRLQGSLPIAVIWFSGKSVPGSASMTWTRKDGQKLMMKFHDGKLKKDAEEINNIEGCCSYRLLLRCVNTKGSAYFKERPNLSKNPVMSISAFSSASFSWRL